MVTSLVEIQQQTVIDAIRRTHPPNTWRCVVTDEASHNVLTNVMDLNKILDEQITDVFKVEEKRQSQPLECIYILTPEEFVVRCMISDFARPKPRYTRAHLQWTSELPHYLRQLILESPARQYIASESVLSIEYYARESHLFTFREPTSFYSLYHPECRDLVMNHLKELSRKIVSVCVSLGEYPTIRFYRPPMRHDAQRLCELLASTAQRELDDYVRIHKDFPPQANRPRGVLFIVDRSLDLYAPLLHEFTYQAMAHDLLPIEDGDRGVRYTVKTTTGQGESEEKDMELTDNDELWIKYRHQHMKDTIDSMMQEFQKFLGDNKNFVDSQSSTSLYAIRDMMATLPQYQGQKDMFSLHLTMAQECMGYFEKQRLPDVALLEQSLATGLDETGRVPRNAADTLVRLLEDPALGPPERLRLILLYILYKDGLLEGDLHKLLMHSALNRRDERVLRALSLLGVRVSKPLKAPPSGAKQKPKRPPSEEEPDNDFSRYSTALKSMLEDHVRGMLDPEMFPFIKPELEPASNGADITTQASLRSAKPTWARSRMSVVEPRQRVIVFMAGGATYSEARACYEVSKTSVRDVFLGSSHMLTPNLWLTQLQSTKEARARLNLLADMPRQEVPKHLLEPDPVPKPPPQVQRPAPPPQPVQRPQPSVEQTTAAMGGMKVKHEVKKPYYLEDKKKKKKKFGVF